VRFGEELLRIGCGQFPFSARKRVDHLAGAAAGCRASRALARAVTMLRTRPAAARSWDGKSKSPAVISSTALRMR
jgi:hypothetical protein